MLLKEAKNILKDNGFEYIKCNETTEQYTKCDKETEKRILDALKQIGLEPLEVERFDMYGDKGLLCDLRSDRS